MGKKTKLNGIMAVALCSFSFIAINSAKADDSSDYGQAVNIVRNNQKSPSDAAGVGVQSVKSGVTNNNIDDFSPLSVYRSESKAKKTTEENKNKKSDKKSNDTKSSDVDSAVGSVPVFTVPVSSSTLGAPAVVETKPVQMASLEKKVVSSPAKNSDLGGKDKLNTGKFSYVSEADMMNELGLAKKATNSVEAGGLESDMRPQDVASYQKIGQPYQVNGKWYIPAHEPDYDESGIASWYGDQFHGKQTANGEVFNMNEITIAHPTLPIPSLVEVTNLENGRSVVARVNDRGPFSSDRIIDVSKRGAEVLGFKDKGTAKVRVRYIGAAPKLDAPKTSPVMMASNNASASAVATNSSSSKTDAKPKTIVKAEPKLSGTFLQIGSFSSRDNAERMKKEKSSYGIINIAEVETNNGKLYRVMMGPFNDSNSANLKKNELADAGMSGVRIVNAD